MKRLLRLGLVTVLLGAFFACDLEQEIDGPEVSSIGAALTAEPEANEFATIEGEEAFLRYVEELKRSSPGFAAALDGIFDGAVTSGDRVVLRAPPPLHDEDCLTDMVSSDDDDSRVAPTNVVAVQDSDAPRTLLEYISDGVPARDLERLDEEGRPLPPDEEPVFAPFRY